MHRFAAIERNLDHSASSLSLRQNATSSSSLGSPMQRFRLTVFCDFDGPILDVSERYYQTYRLALDEVHGQSSDSATLVHQLTKEQFWQMKQNRVPDAEIAMRSGLQPEQIDRFLARVAQIVNQPALLHQDELQPGVRWALAFLHTQGAKLVLVTLRCQQQATQILQNYGLAHLFTQIVGSQDDQAAYQNLADHKTRLLAIAAQSSLPAPRPGTPHSTAWMVGDTEADVLAGQALNIPTVALTCGIRSKRYLQKFNPTRIHSDLLSAAHYLVYQQENASAVVA